jgi:methylase of polypeptide subunit release factors
MAMELFTHSTPEGTISLYGGPDVYHPLGSTLYAIKILTDLVTEHNLTNQTVLDLGAGAGGIGTLVKVTHPTFDVHFVENDLAAQPYIEKNLKENGVKKADVTINMLDADLVGTTYDAGTFDVVISTPPTLPDIIKTLGVHNTNENDPAHTVYGGAHGTELHAKFINAAKQVLKSEGFIIVHCTKSQVETAYEVPNMLLDAGFTNITYILDDNDLPEDSENFPAIQSGWVVAQKI